MKALFNKLWELVLASWDKIATLTASALAGAGVMVVLGEPSAWLVGALAGLTGRLIGHVEIRL